jgi:hypothetical protein
MQSRLGAGRKEFIENSIRLKGIHVEPTYKLDKVLGIL